jgi:Glycosyltransferase family 87
MRGGWARGAEAGLVTAGLEVAGTPRSDDAAAEGRPVSLRGLALAAPLALRHVTYILLALSAVIWMYSDLRWGYDNGALAFDFLGTLWEPGVAILNGDSPYPPPVVSEVDVGNPGYYPPLLMVLVAPLTVLPWAVGAVLWTALIAAALVGTLYVLGVRDLRCYALALISAPVVNGLMWGNATLVLVFLVALVWRWRDHASRSAAVLGVAIAIKLFLWPLLFWQLGTRRYRPAAIALAVAVAGVLVPWAVIGFEGFLAYPDLLRVAQDVYALHGYSTATALGALGVETEAASWTGLVIGGAVGVMAFVAGRRGADDVSFSLAILAALVASPIVWEHYFAFLLVPLAIARPRFSALWIALPLFHFAQSLPAPTLTSSEIEPGGSACCPPEGMPLSAWVVSHAPPALWPVVGHAVLAATVIGLGARAMTRRSRLRETSA